MSALDDAERAVAEARRAIHESLVGLPAWAADAAREELHQFEQAVRAYDAEIARSEGHHWSGEPGRAILHTADLIHPQEDQ